MSVNMATCPHCGASVNASSRFCILCGQPMSDSPATETSGAEAPEQGGPAEGVTSVATDGAGGGTVSASIGSAPPPATFGEDSGAPVPVASLLSDDESSEALSLATGSPTWNSSPMTGGTEASSVDVTPEASDVLIPDSALESTASYAPQSAQRTLPTSDATALQFAQAESRSGEHTSDAVMGEEAGANPADADSWYGSLASSPGDSPAGDTILISPQMDSAPAGTPTLNIGGSGEVAGSSGYAPPTGYSPQPFSPGSSAPFTPPPTLSSAPMQPPQAPPPYMPPPQSPSFYSPPPQAQGQGQGQPVFMPPPQYSQAPPTTQMQGYNSAPIYPAYAAQPAATGKDPTVALLLELIGYAGVLGVGHIYAGRTNRGIALLVGWIFYLTAATILTFVCIGCVMFIVWPFVPILSGLWIKNDLDKERMMGMQR